MINSAFKHRATGKVVMTLVDNGVVVNTFVHNLVVDGAYQLMTDWASQDFSESISQIALGTGGNVPGDPSTPIPPVEDDSDLVAEVGRKAIATISKTSPNTVEYVTTFLSGEGSGQLTEAGLFSSNNRLFARVTFSLIAKSTMTLIVRWIVTI